MKKATVSVRIWDHGTMPIVDNARREDRILGYDGKVLRMKHAPKGMKPWTVTDKGVRGLTNYGWLISPGWGPEGERMDIPAGEMARALEELGLT